MTVATTLVDALTNLAGNIGPAIGIGAGVLLAVWMVATLIASR